MALNSGSGSKSRDSHAATTSTTEQLSSVYSHRIASAADLEAIDSELSQGDVAYVVQPDTPYRTDAWLDIDTSDVTVVFESQWAKDGNAIVKPADGADVGGIRIGNGSAVNDVTVVNYGHDGNDTTMTDSVKNLTAVVIDQATDCVVRNTFATRTHPYHEHNTGGSGIRVTSNASDCRIYESRFDDIGDQGVSIRGGSDIYVEGIFATNGYDRALSVGSSSTDITAKTVRSRDNTDGSVVGISQPAVDVHVEDVVGRGEHKRLFFVDAGGSAMSNITLDGFVGHQETQVGTPGIEVQDGATEVTISDGHLENYQSDCIQIAGQKVEVSGVVCKDGGNRGIDIVSTADDVTVSDSTTTGSSGPGVEVDSGAGDVLLDGVTSVSDGGRGFNIDAAGVDLVGCRALEAGSHGIWVSGNDCVVSGCRASSAGGNGIRVGGNRVVVTGCKAIDNSDDVGDGVLLAGNDCVVSGCQLENNTDGIDVQSGASRNVLGGNSFTNNGMNIRTDGTYTRIDGRVQDTYTGDGNQNRRITLGFRPSVVYVEEAGGTLHEVRDDGLSLINGSSPTGELSIEADGFDIGDNGNDSDPNTDTESYTFVAIA